MNFARNSLDTYKAAAQITGAYGAYALRLGYFIFYTDLTSIFYCPAKPMTTGLSSGPRGSHIIPSTFYCSKIIFYFKSHVNMQSDVNVST